ncbi:hypothetical protein ACS0TY_024339 [Phlomoides rotata]
MDRMCGCCNMDIESAWHIFMNCNFAKEVWQLSLVHGKVEELALMTDSVEDLVLVFNSRRCTAATTSHLARKFLLDWRVSRCSSKNLGPAVHQQPVSCRAWHRPPVGRLKLNVDTAFFEDSAEMGFGMVIRDNNGVHFFNHTLAMPGVYAPEEGEAIGLFEALSWIKELDIRNVEIEMDAQVVVSAFNSRDSSSISVFGDIIQACKNVFISYPHCKVGWVNRQANELAHNLARVARDFTSPFVWAELPAIVECRPYTSCTC